MSDPILRRRLDAVYLFDAVQSRCNGEPNDGGRPRQDPETNHLWWNDAALKRFIREGLLQEKGDKPPWRVLVQHGYPLNRSQTEAFDALGVDLSAYGAADDDGATKTSGKKKKVPAELGKAAREWIAKNFADVRFFGGVLDTGYQIGNLTGPLQFMIAESVHAASVNEGAVTRVTVTTEKDLANVKDREMGTKFVVPYALFRGMWFYTPAFGEKTGFSVEDLAVFIDLMRDPFRYRQSGGLGMTTMRKAWVFLHDGARGGEQAGLLRDRVQIGVDADAPRDFRDFSVRFDDAGLADKGIKVYTEETLDQLVEEVRARPGEAR